MSERIVVQPIALDRDVVSARQRSRQIAGLLGFEAQDQTRVATAVSEIVRNAYRYAGGGEVEFSLEGDRPAQSLVVTVTDHGPGIADLDAILSGRYASSTGMGLGIVGAHRLVDRCEIRTERGRGTQVTLRKRLPSSASERGGPDVARLRAELATAAAPGTQDELQQQHAELMRALAELNDRQEQMQRINRELEDTNRGVVALYAELEEKADRLRRADETKSRFLSNMSHEFRTPLNSVHALTGLLLDETDGPLNDEQRKQVELVRKAASDLSQLVEDLLDLAKIEAGKVDVQPTEFSAQTLFSALRGMLRPLLVSEAIALRFDVAPDVPPLYTDEAKVSQILRNFISNALKFTERGDIRVTAEVTVDGRAVRRRQLE
jgi:signal transduction histidine kinase